MTETTPQTFILHWSGIEIRIDFEPTYMSGPYCHLEVTSIAPERAALPITETGYKSHFGNADEIEASGGPVAFVIGSLDEAAMSQEWLAKVIADQQLSLF